MKVLPSLRNKDIIRGCLTFGPQIGQDFLFVVVDITMGIVSQPLNSIGAARLCAVRERYGRVMSIDRLTSINRVESCKLPNHPTKEVTAKDSQTFKENAEAIMKHLTKTGSFFTKNKNKEK